MNFSQIKTLVQKVRKTVRDYNIYLLVFKAGLSLYLETYKNLKFEKLRKKPEKT